MHYQPKGWRSERIKSFVQTFNQTPSHIKLLIADISKQPSKLLFHNFLLMLLPHSNPRHMSLLKLI